MTAQSAQAVAMTKRRDGELESGVPSPAQSGSALFLGESVFRCYSSSSSNSSNNNSNNSKSVSVVEDASSFLRLEGAVVGRTVSRCRRALDLIVVDQVTDVYDDERPHARTQTRKKKTTSSGDFPTWRQRPASGGAAGNGV